MAAPLVLLREINTCHENMLLMAKALDWDGVSKEWQGTESNFFTLMKTSLTELRGNDRAEARQLIENLLKLQKLISAQAKPWMDQVRPLLDSFDRYPLTSIEI